MLGLHSLLDPIFGHQIGAEILRTLRRKRGQHSRRSPPADGRNTREVEGATPKAQPDHRKIEGQLREKPSELTGRDETELVISPQFGFVAELISRNSPERNTYLIEDKLGIK